MNLVVDTNVAVTAGAPPGSNPGCVVRCLGELSAIQRGNNRLALDDGWHIIREYKSNLISSGEPRAGALFLRWVLENMYNTQWCIRAQITPDEGREFLEFPDDSRLRGFDRSDRKFVAVALAVDGGAEILNATDSDWQNAAAALAQNGVRVRELCLALANGSAPTAAADR